MRQSHKNIAGLIKILAELLDSTPDLVLYTAPEGLYLVETKVGRVLAAVPCLSISAGDPERVLDDKGNVAYLDLK